jgi:hypothetical protein
MDFPTQQTVAFSGSSASPGTRGAYDMRAHLNPRRMTMVMWDQAFLLRHQAGESFADWEQVLNETVERGYNTLRLDPMPQCINMEQPDQELTWGDNGGPYLPWDWQRKITLPAGRALIEFMQLAAQHNLWMTLSNWWFTGDAAPAGTVTPRSTMEGAELWARMLRVLQREVGFERIAYIDFANEMPYFFPNFMQQLAAVDPQAGFGGYPVISDYTEVQKAWLRDNLDKPIAALQAEFPQLRFTHSIHGDQRWLNVGLTAWDCLDVHFYSDADPRWAVRTHFGELIKDGGMFNTSAGYKAFSDRSTQTYKAIGPMLHARQRNVIHQFSNWSEALGMPITCTEGWCSWFYVDHPDLDWGWLLEYSEHAIEDAIEFGFWGVTPNNYVQPQFELWKNVRWHQRINEKFLAS